MSKIQIDNLQTAGSELFDGGESFLTELQATEAHTIFGGKSKKKDKYGPNVVVIQQPQPQLPQQPIFIPVFYGPGFPGPGFPGNPGFPCPPRPCGC
jgi:hypothetical protein